MSKTNAKARAADMLGFPRDVVMKIPRLQMLGDQQILLENHAGVLEYTPDIIKLQTTPGILTIAGESLNIRFIGPKDVQILGKICSLSFE